MHLASAGACDVIGGGGADRAGVCTWLPRVLAMSVAGVAGNHYRIQPS